YIRLPFNSEYPGQPSVLKSTAKDIVKFMKEAWNLKTPELIICVTGGAQELETIPTRIRDAFKRSLIAAAVTTGNKSKTHNLKKELVG
ncbi:unnamed protein product, partial [Didymodactylos carnosus]